MTRTMYDSTNPAAIPVTAGMVAGYVDGAFVWPAAGWARFPRAVKVRIAVFASTNDGVVLDVERGDAAPAQAPGWVQRRRAAGMDPSVYCSISLWPAVRAAFHAAGVAEPHYWVAGYPAGGAVIPGGAIAHQYADPLTSGGQWDLSVVADYWPGIDPAGGNVSTPNSPDDDAVLAYVAGGNRVKMPDGQARNLFDCAYDTAQRLIGVAANIDKITTALGLVDADVKAAQTAEMTVLQGLHQIGAADLQQPLHDALTALGWTPPPTTTDTATAVLTAIKTQLTK